MLQICDISKKYVTGELVQTALDGVSLTLRDNEFVAILGPSGSGKTTLLNVIGGLDRYDSGDLIINGISTKKYSDRDWDSYRNHTIGFVFQSYNLIPHQTVLSNVELALTISGISRSERRKRAKKALEEVGLGNQLHKKPNQMSGGQMQRVAIARALVNNPDILLADEPTGALDSETSVQVMELLKEVSRDRLVVMVTHNPELAEEYANRIVRVKDGKIIDDSNPYSVGADEALAATHKNMGRASMSFLTALSLSFNNLRTKLGRTLLTAFAGSIGIIGIALIMSISTGFQNYIDKIQEDTLSNYPLTLMQETADMGAAMAAVGSMLNQSNQVEAGVVVEQQMISQMFSQIGSNDLGAFKEYLEDNISQIDGDINDIVYSYGVKPLIYSLDTSNGIQQVNPGVLFGELTGSSAMSSYMDSDVFKQMLGNMQLLESQYDVLQGRWPEAANEMIFVLSDPGSMSDYMAYTLGLKDGNILKDMIKNVMNGQEAGALGEPDQWTYDDLMAMEFSLVPSSSLYRYNEEYSVWEDMSGDEAYMRERIGEGTALKIVGIVCPQEGVSATILSPGIAYTSGLTNLMMEAAASSQIVQQQLSDSTVDVFTGKSFDQIDEENSPMDFQDMISVDKDMLSSAFGVNVDEDAIIALLEQYMNDVSGSLEVDTAPAQKDFLSLLSTLATDMLNWHLSENADPVTGNAILRLSDAETLATRFLERSQTVSLMAELENKYQLPAGTMTEVCRPLLIGFVTVYIAQEMAVPEVPDMPTIPDLPTIPETTESTEPAGVSLPEEETVTATEPTQPENPFDFDFDPEALYAPVTADRIPGAVASFMENPLVTGAAGAMATKMMEAEIQEQIMRELSGFGNILMRYFSGAFYVNEEAFSQAFQFNMNEEELRRLMDAMSGKQEDRSAESNLRNLGYADPDSPISISVYFADFAAKEHFIAFLDDYNDKMEAAEKTDQVISYTDITGIMMSSVRTIIDSVSYVLIAFVAVSLIVSSIMIGIITYISVMERTKEIGVLRAIGASKRNISQVFNAETFIIGLCSGVLGVGISMLLNFPINYIIHSLTDNPDIQAQLPVASIFVLIILSMCLTMIGGLIPSRHAAKKDPVIALRTE